MRGTYETLYTVNPRSKIPDTGINESGTEPDRDGTNCVFISLRSAVNSNVIQACVGTDQSKPTGYLLRVVRGSFNPVSILRISLWSHACFERSGARNKSVSGLRQNAALKLAMSGFINTSFRIKQRVALFIVACVVRNNDVNDKAVTTAGVN